jgi:hypothetical protein
MGNQPRPGTVLIQLSFSAGSLGPKKISMDDPLHQRDRLIGLPSDLEALTANATEYVGNRETK